MRGRGGHGHNDILSFELFMNGFNVVSDCGSYLYTASREWRNLFRSTAFHNTVQVDDEELNRFLGPDALWQLHDDAKPVGAEMRVGTQADCFRGGHSGYARLAPPVSHVREIVADKHAPRVLVSDRLAGDGVRRLTWRFHLDPAVDAELRGCDVRLSQGGRSVWLLPDDAAAAFAFSVEDGWVSPSYGVKAPTKVLVWKAEARLPAEASYLFSNDYLSSQERRIACETLRRSSAC